eukprot:5777744-Ditylum_brightwellii.AAC.1
MDDDGAYTADAIRNNTAIAVSDGSYKSPHSAAACIIEGSTPNLHSITAEATNPGGPEIQDAYRAELAGIYMI